MNQEHLDHIFGALSDATRRGMLEQLSRGEANVSALASSHEMSQPAISKHLKVLERAGLIRKQRRGREQFVRVNPEAAKAAQAWIDHYSRYWAEQFDAVDAYLQSKKETKQ